jgi:hypothetical protein
MISIVFMSMFYGCNTKKVIITMKPTGSVASIELNPFPGIALRGETCGAVIGCLMALGLEFGREDLSDRRGEWKH